MVLPRLCLTGATLGDLYRQEALLAAAWDALLRLAANAKSLDLLAVVGLPVRQGGRLYDCAAAIGGGEVLWLCPRREAQAPFSPGPETGVFPEVAAPFPWAGAIIWPVWNFPDWSLASGWRKTYLKPKPRCC